MHFSLYRARLGALFAVLALVAALAIPTAASAQSYDGWGSSSYGYGSYPSSSSSYGSYPSSSSYGSSSYGYGGYGGFGSISESTGLPRTNYVSGYTRSDGSYVSPYYRSHR